MVSSIPEGLPAVLAIVLAIGAYRMAQSKAIVRHLPVIEDLSVTSVVITDKTGTLTQNTMTARSVVTVEKEYEVGGEGWDATGQFFYNREVVDPLREHVLSKLLAICGLCNNSTVNREEKGVEIVLASDQLPAETPDSPTQVRQHILLQKVLFWTPSLDLTEDVITKLNGRYKAATPAAGPITIDSAQIKPKEPAQPAPPNKP